MTRGFVSTFCFFRSFAIITMLIWRCLCIGFWTHSLYSIPAYLALSPCHHHDLGISSRRTHNKLKNQIIMMCSEPFIHFFQYVSFFLLNVTLRSLLHILIRMWLAGWLGCYYKCVCVRFQMRRCARYTMSQYSIVRVCVYIVLN